MEVVGYRSPFYPPSKDYEESEAGIERLMKAIYGDLDPEEMADLKEQRLVLGKELIRAASDHGMSVKPCAEGDELAPFGADCGGCMRISDYEKAMLRKAGRPVCRRDMLTAMDSAIMTRVASFEKKADMANAALLLATVICKNILTDGPLHEEA